MLIVLGKLVLMKTIIYLKMKLCFSFPPRQFQEQTSVIHVKEFQNIQQMHIMHWWANSEVAKVFKLYF